MQSDFTLKQGETLRLGLAFQTDAGAPIDVSSGTIKVQLRDVSDNLVQTLTVQPGAGTGLSAIKASSATWPIGRLVLDISLSLAGVTDISETVFIAVQPAVTQP